MAEPAITQVLFPVGHGRGVTVDTNLKFPANLIFPGAEKS